MYNKMPPRLNRGQYYVIIFEYVGMGRSESEIPCMTSIYAETAQMALNAFLSRQASSKYTRIPLKVINLSLNKVYDVAESVSYRIKE